MGPLEEPKGFDGVSTVAFCRPPLGVEGPPQNPVGSGGAEPGIAH